MQTIQKEYKVYEFGELSPEVQAEVIDNNRDVNIYSDQWHDPILEGWQEKLATLGYEDAEINYTGFWSQGDGASFTSKNIDLWMWIKAHKLGNKYESLKKVIEDGELTASIDRVTHHYCHKKTVSCTIHDGDYPEKLGDLVSELGREIDSITEDYARELYEDLEQYYSELQSDDAVIEALADTMFLDNGRIYDEEAA